MTKGEQMKKIIGVILSVLIVLGVGYGLGERYYENRFQANSSFEGVDISHLKVEDAHQHIAEVLTEQTLTFTEDSLVKSSITLEELEAEIDAMDLLHHLMASQQQTTWFSGFFNPTTYHPDVQDFITIPDKAIDDTIEKLAQNYGERSVSTDAYLAYGENQGYYIEPETTGTELDIAKVKTLAVEALLAGEQTLELSDAYKAPSITSDNQELISVLDEIEAAASTQITLTIAGYEEVITRDMIMNWLYLDDNHKIQFDETLIFEYLGTLNERYATYDDYRYFESTLQGQVQLLPGTLGWSIDRELESEAIMEELHAGVQVTREAHIVGTGYNGYSLDDIGSSYIEVDILNQTMFVYIDGEQVISTPVVTGQIGTNTIPGTYAIWNKETPSALRGYNPRTEQDYVQPVQYWMAFDDTGQGIHDADWQPSFGGDIYLTNGSLGCVNTPPGIMPTVFEYAYAGMPVVVFE